MNAETEAQERLKKGQGSSGFSQDLRGRQSVVNDQMISRLFQAYFNNKMTLLLFLIQARQLKPNAELVGKVQNFLEDLYHHMLEECYQKQYRLIFKWLGLFSRKLPDVSSGQRDKAKDFVRAIYDAFGLHLKTDI